MRIICILIVLLIGSFGAFGQDSKSDRYGLLLDNSGSMRQQWALNQEIAKELTKKLVKSGTVSLFSFATDPDLFGLNLGVVTDCGNDSIKLGEMISALQIAGGRTTFLDSLMIIFERLGTEGIKDCKTAKEKALYIISDGEDRISVTKIDELKVALKKSGIKVYAIGMVKDLQDPFSFGKKTPKKKAISLLETITSESGGKVIYPKDKESAETIVKNLLS